MKGDHLLFLQLLETGIHRGPLVGVPQAFIFERPLQVIFYISCNSLQNILTEPQPCREALPSLTQFHVYFCLGDPQHWTIYCTTATTNLICAQCAQCACSHTCKKCQLAQALFAFIFVLTVHILVP